MNNDDKITKGRHVLRMKIAQKYGEENLDSELLKIPLEGLHSVALQQIGEQEAYIEELEEKIAHLEKELAKKEAKACLTREENKKIAQEVRRDRVIEKIYSDSKKHKAENKRLKTINREIVTMMCKLELEIESLKQRLDEAEFQS